MNPQLDAVVTRLREALGDALVGIYLHGSLALGCFNPRCSDLDLLVVTRRPLADRERAALETLPRGVPGEPGWPRPVELSVLVEEQLRPWRHPTPYDAHLSSGAVQGAGVDPDLAAHVTVVRQAGVALVGPPAVDVFPEVPRGDFVASLLGDVEYCLTKRARSRYAILGLARVWATLAEPDVLHNKATGAEWALERLPPARRTVLERALESYRGEGGELDVGHSEFDAYAEDVAARIANLHE